MNRLKLLNTKIKIKDAIRRPRLGLALGGGGVRGMAHVGFLDILEKNDIHISGIAGTSIGAIVAAAYTLDQNYSSERLENVFIGLGPYIPQILKSNINSNVSSYQKITRYINAAHLVVDTFLGWGPLSSETSFRLLHSITGNKMIEEADIPLAIVAVDLINGEKVVLKEGRADRAIQASSAMPGYSPPVLYGEKLLMDGGIIDMVPVDVCRTMDVDIVIAIDVDQDTAPVNIYNGLEACLRAIELCSRHHKKHILKKADLVIRPEFADPVQTLDISKIRECIHAGRKAAEDNLQVIVNLTSP